VSDRKPLTVKDLKDYLAVMEARWGVGAFDGRRIHIMDLDEDEDASPLVTDIEMDCLGEDEGHVLSLTVWRKRDEYTAACRARGNP